MGTNPAAKTTNMKKLPAFILLQIHFLSVNAQMDVPPSGGNPRAMVSEEVGITSISIRYGRPDVNKREGKVFGEGKLVTYGFSTTNFITNGNTSPWRAGANEATTISFEHDVKVEGKEIKAGTYALFMAMGAEKATLIFSKETDAWGSFYYKEEDDVLRVEVPVVPLEKSVEWLKYEFIEHGEKHCRIALQWEKLSVPFRVDVDVDNIVIARLREQVTSQKGFNSNNMLQAAQYCLNKNINLEEALQWSIRAITGFQGQKSFITLRNLANAYDKLKRTAQADSTMDEALTIATANQYTAYGRQLITQKRPDRAMEVFKASEKRYGDSWGVNNGLMSGYSARGDFKKALQYAEKALTQAPSEGAKSILEGQIAKLKEGKDINQ